MRISQYRPPEASTANTPATVPIHVLAFYDEEGWAWWHRARQISKYMPPDVRMDIRKVDQPFDHHDYDLLLLFDAQLLDLMRHVPREKLILGSSCPALTEEAIGILKRESASAGLVNSMEAYLSYQADYRLYCCQNGVDEELFAPGAEAPQEWIACWVGNSKSIGNKGLDLIREACRMAGVGLLDWDKAARPKHEALLTQEEVRDRIYRRSTFYICASEFEGTPNPMLEAMACGLPVVSTRVGNAPELIRPGYNGFLSDRTAESLAAAIMKLKACDRATLSRNARASILDGWTWRHQARKYAAAFRESAARNRGAPGNPKKDYTRLLWVDPERPEREDVAAAFASLMGMFPDAEIGVACAEEWMGAYQGLAGVKMVWGYDRARASASAEYRSALLQMWSTFKADLVLNAAKRPDLVAEILALGPLEAEKVGIRERLRAYPPEFQEQFRPRYTRLIESGPGMGGMAHARQFVNALGAAPAALPAMAGDPSWVPMPGAPRVLMVVHMFPPYWFAGVEVHTLHLAQALRARGCDVSVFFPLVMPDQSGFYLVKGHYAGVPVHALSHGGRGSKLFNHEWPELDGEFSALLARERYDVVHFQHSIGLSFRMFDIARESGARTCLTLHDFWMMCQRVHFYVESEHRMCEGPETAAKCAACAIGPAWAGMEAARKSAAESLFAQRAEINKRIFAGLDVITAPTRYVQRKLEQFGYADPRRIEIRSLGLLPVARKQRAPRGGPLRFAFLGTIHPLKNVFMLSKAFGDVLGEASLAFHGEGKIEHVERLRESVKADARQSYAGKYVPADLGDILAAVDVVVICSITENYPLVAREALSAGVPVIGSRAGGIPEIIEDGVSGLLFDPAKPQQLTACIQRLVDQPDLVAELRGKIPAVKTMEEEAAEWAERYARLQASALSPRPTAGLPVHR